jgi:hypothetical protein
VTFFNVVNVRLNSENAPSPRQVDSCLPSSKYVAPQDPLSNVFLTASNPLYQPTMHSIATSCLAALVHCEPTSCPRAATFAAVTPTQLQYARWLPPQVSQLIVELTGCSRIFEARQQVVGAMASWELIYCCSCCAWQGLWPVPSRTAFQQARGLQSEALHTFISLASCCAVLLSSGSVGHASLLPNLAGPVLSRTFTAMPHTLLHLGPLARMPVPRHLEQLNVERILPWCRQHSFERNRSPSLCVYKLRTRLVGYLQSSVLTLPGLAPCPLFAPHSSAKHSPAWPPSTPSTRSGPPLCALGVADPTPLMAARHVMPASLLMWSPFRKPTNCRARAAGLITACCPCVQVRMCCVAMLTLTCVDIALCCAVRLELREARPWGAPSTS